MFVVSFHSLANLAPRAIYQVDCRFGRGLPFVSVGQGNAYQE